MIVLILSAVPTGLRGHLTRWLIEVSAGVFVGHVSTRVRDLLWLRVVEMSKNGRALMVYEVPTEQRLSFITHGHHWEPVDLDGITLMMRPAPDAAPGPGYKPGWSNASKRRRFGATGTRKK
jgi:CRISPR-associated protein Cas2